jgi:hypothetical protein
MVQILLFHSLQPEIKAIPDLQVRLVSLVHREIPVLPDLVDLLDLLGRLGLLVHKETQVSLVHKAPALLVAKVLPDLHPPYQDH